MPEHDEHRTDDLDVVFHGLVDDVAGRGRPRGADEAVRAAGSRRTMATSTLVVALAVVTGLVGWGLQGGQRAAVPATPPASTVSSAFPAPPVDGPDVSAPARLDVQRLDEADIGWKGWERATDSTVMLPSCQGRALAGPEPAAVTTEHFRVPGTVEASLQRVRLASRSDSNLAMRAAVVEYESCPENTASAFDDVSADLEVVAFPWRRGDRRGIVWLVNFENRMDVFRVATPGPLPSDDLRREVSRLLAADVQVP